jgi:hypothetical protein
MKVTKEIRKKAAEIAETQNADVLYVNERGEFFTDKSLALLSVEGNADGFAKIEVVASVAVKTAAGTDPDNEDE